MIICTTKRNANTNLWMFYFSETSMEIDILKKVQSAVNVYKKFLRLIIKTLVLTSSPSQLKVNV